MSETKMSPSPVFPEIGQEGRVSENFWIECEALRDLWQKPGGEYERDAKLPQVVGYIPDEERALFESFDHRKITKNTHNGYGHLGLDGIQEVFPGIWEIITRDLERLGLKRPDDPRRVNIDLNRRFILANHVSDGLPHSKTDDAAAPQGSWHIDNPSQSFRDGSGLDPLGDPTEIRYLMRNRYPTLFYEGPAPMAVGEYSGVLDSVSKTIELAGDFNLAAGLAIPAPDWAVVRLGPLTPHSRSVFPEDAWGSFMRVIVTPEQEICNLNPNQTTSPDSAQFLESTDQQLTGRS